MIFSLSLFLQMELPNEREAEKPTTTKLYLGISLLYLPNAIDLREWRTTFQTKQKKKKIIMAKLFRCFYYECRPLGSLLCVDKSLLYYVYIIRINAQFIIVFDRLSGAVNWTLFIQW